MTTRTWTPLTTGHYDNADNWSGVAPQPGDTDIISSVGGSAPTILNHIYQTGGTASQVYLYNFASPSLPEDAALAQTPAGDTISGQTIDVQGDNDYTVLDIRRTTLAASTTLNDPSTTIVNADYDNSLDGTINVGQSGLAPAPAGDTYTRLNLNLYGYGSVDLHGGPPSTYVPSTINSGTINAADSSWLDIQLITGAGGATQLPTQFGDLVAVNGAVPGYADFTNNGAINIAPGSLFYLEDGGAENSIHFGTFTNNGNVLIQGAQSVTGTSFISAPIVGSGTITVDGGTQTDPTATMLHVNASIVNSHIVLRDATLYATDGTLDTRDTGGSLDFEGNAILRVNGEGDTSTTGTPAVTTGLLYPFGMPIYGFGAGDVIENDQAPLGISAVHSDNPAAEMPTSTYVDTEFGSTTTTYTFMTAWNQATHDLSVEYTSTTPQSELSPTGGFVNVPVTTGPFLIGNFTLMGTYDAADFHATFIPSNTLDANGNLLLGAPGDGRVNPEVMVTTTQAAPTYAVTTAAAAGGTVFTSAPIGGSAITATAHGNDVVQSTGNDTVNAGGGSDIVFASGGAATVNGGAGALTFVAGGGSYTASGGSAADVLYGGSGNSTLTGGAGAYSIIVAGTGNASLVGGAGSGALMFGGTASSRFIGSAGGSDTLVGGAGENSFTLTAGDIAFGGPTGPDSFTAGAGSSLIVEGAGATTVTLGSGNVTAFGGPGADTYVVAAGSGSASIVGFKFADHIVLAGGTAAQVAQASASATVGSFGTLLSRCWAARRSSSTEQASARGRSPQAERAARRSTSKAGLSRRCPSNDLSRSSEHLAATPKPAREEASLNQLCLSKWIPKASPWRNLGQSLSLSCFRQGRGL